MHLCIFNYSIIVLLITPSMNYRL